MGFVPEGEQWFIAEMVHEIRVQDDPQNLVQRILFLIQASSAEEAYDEALQAGADYNLSYRNPNGKEVTCKFHGLRDLRVVLDVLGHGSELWIDDQADVDEAGIRAMVAPKEALTVFAPEPKTGGPDFRSRETMERLYRQYPELRPKG